MAVKDIVIVTVTRETQAVAVASFGTPMIASAFLATKTATDFTRIRYYADSAEMIADGWTSSDDEYKKASALMAQNPRINRFAIGRKDTADADWATALNAIASENNEWYGVLCIPDGTYNDDILAVAAWVETQPKILFVQATETSVLTATTTDLPALLKAQNYDRSASIYHLAANSDENLEAGWMGENFPYDPGSSTYAYKTPSGATADTISSAERGHAFSKNCAIFHHTGGVDITEEGKVASGEWIDVMIGVDWVTARLQEAVFGKLVNLRKLSYDDAGITVVQGLVNGVLQEAGRKGILQADSIVVTVPKYADIAQADKIARNLPDVKFTALLQGAIHTVEINGTVSV